MNQLTYRLLLKPLTPVHIGAGDTLDPYEYLISDRLYRFKPEDFLSKLNESEREIFINLAQKNMISARKLMSDRQSGISGISEYSLRVSERAKEIYEQRIGNPESDLSAYPFIRTSNSPYLPGSSVKGAIRTAMLYRKMKKPSSEVDARRLQAETFNYAKYIDGVYKRPDITRDMFKCLKIGDSRAIQDATILRCLSVHTKKDNQWTEALPLLIETTMASFSDRSDIEFELTMQVQADLASKEYPITVMDIVDACREFYSLNMREERKYLSSLPLAAALYDQLQAANDSLKENSFLMRLGRGSGFDAVTINYARSFRETKKSRLLSEGAIPMGWVHVSFESV